MVKYFVENGANVGFTYHELSADKTKVIAYASNAADFEASEQLMNQFLEDFGQIDILVNNAGITKDNLMLRMKEDEWDAVINTNLKSVFNLSKQVLKPMMRARKGSIINITSIVGQRGQAGQANYAASKAGIIGFTKSLAKEMGARNIRCNAIAPGYIATDMTHELNEAQKSAFLEGLPLKRAGEAQEVAQAVAFLASDLSQYITGQVLSVCGGMNC
ncbi:UNVERIFIED_CONTAM: hypothetical protein GTU68_059235 [Idotea baltica]|nr:hypothetical protein [Idotea baltica]